MAEPFYDRNALKDLPIVEVAQAFGIEVNRKGGSAWCRLRDERTPSCKLYETTNTWCDFGDGRRGGDTISLVAYVENISNDAAMQRLAERFGIAPIKNDPTQKPSLSYRQWEKIGIAGELATMNFNFDIDKYGVEKTAAFSEKFRMTVNELREQYPKVYENMLRYRAIPFVYDQRQEYYRCVWNRDSIHQVMGVDLTARSDAMGELRLMAAGMNNVEHLMVTATKDTTIRYKPVAYDVTTDIQKIRSGEISFEVGNVRYFDLKNAVQQSGQKLAYINKPVTVRQYAAQQNKLDAIEYAAFVKGDKVNIAVKPSDAGKLQSIFTDTTQKQTKKL